MVFNVIFSTNYNIAISVAFTMDFIVTFPRIGYSSTTLV